MPIPTTPAAPDHRKTMETESTVPSLLFTLEAILPLDLLHNINTHREKLMVSGVLLVAGYVAWTWWMGRNKKLPGPWSWPIFGHIKTLCHNPHLTLTHFHRIYGDLYQLKVGQKTIVVVGCLETILDGLMDSEDKLSDRPDFQNFSLIYDAAEGRQRGLCTAGNGEKSNVRKTFVAASIDAYCSDIPHIEEKLSSDIVDTINRLIDMPGEIEPFSHFKPACFNIIYRLVFNQRLDPQGKFMKDTLTAMESRAEVLQFNPVDFCPLLKIFTTEDHASYVQDCTAYHIQLQHKHLNLHKDTYDRNNIRDMADHLLLYIENGEDLGLLSKEDIDYLLLDTVTFGYQATALTLTWLIGFMAANHELQAKVQKEIDSVVGRDRLPGMEDQPYLPLTTAAILETLRLASIHPFVIPHSATENTTLQGFHIPKGSIILFNVWKIHHDPKYWGNPHQYNPYRFLDADNQLEIPDYFLPFSAGPRRCPGEGLADATLFLFFTTIMHQIVIQPETGFPLTSNYDYLMRPKTFTVSVQEREQAEDFFPSA